MGKLTTWRQSGSLTSGLSSSPPRWQLSSHTALRTHVTMYPLGHRATSVLEAYTNSTSKSPWGYIMANEAGLCLWGCVMIMSPGSTIRGEATACLLLWLLCQSGVNKLVFSSYDSLRFLPTTLLMPCLPWIQGTMCTMRNSETTGIVTRIPGR